MILFIFCLPYWHFLFDCFVDVLICIKLVLMHKWTILLIFRLYLRKFGILGFVFMRFLNFMRYLGFYILINFLLYELNVKCLFWFLCLRYWFWHIRFWILFHPFCRIRRDIIWRVRLRKFTLLVGIFVQTSPTLLDHSLQNIWFVHIVWNQNLLLNCVWLFFLRSYFILFLNFLTGSIIFELKVVFWKGSRIF